MKKLMLILFLVISSNTIYSQDVIDNFIVGPYEVDYKGEGDVNFRLRKGIDLYEYFNLRKDTIIQVSEDKGTPMKHGIQINLLYSLPSFTNGRANTLGLDASWKQNIAKKIYINTGFMFAMTLGEYNAFSLKENMIEIGLPISIEFSNINKKKASLYTSIGITPTFYKTVKEDFKVKIKEVEEKPSGFLIAPKIDLGCYMPWGKQILRLGGFCQYKINCSNSDYDQFKEHIGRAYIGMNLGVIF